MLKQVALARANKKGGKAIALGARAEARLPPLLSDSDEDLAGRVISGDAEAFSELVRRHAPRFYRFAFRILLREADARDVVQDAFLKFWQRPALWDSQRGSRFISWFYKILLNICRDRYRAGLKLVSLEESLLNSLPEPDPEETSLQHQRDREILQAMNALPARQREAMGLCFYEGMRRDDAAAALGVSLKALESLLMRAKATLRAHILEEERL